MPMEAYQGQYAWSVENTKLLTADFLICIFGMTGMLGGWPTGARVLSGF